jgi:hypothetical protein
MHFDGWCFSSFGFPKCPWLKLQQQQQLTKLNSSNYLTNSHSHQRATHINKAVIQFMWVDERAGLSFTVAAGPRQCNNSCFSVPRNLWPYFTFSDSRLADPGGLGSRVYVPQKEGGPIVPPTNWVHLHGDSASSKSEVKVKVKVILRPTFSWPAWFGARHPSGDHAKFVIPSDSWGFVEMGRPLWREDGFVFYSCRCASPA